MSLKKTYLVRHGTPTRAGIGNQFIDAMLCDSGGAVETVWLKDRTTDDDGARSISAFGDELSSVDYPANVWLVLNSPDAILTAERLSANVGQFASLVWDEPGYIASGMRSAKKSEPMLAAARRTLSRSRAIVGMSEQMLSVLAPENTRAARIVMRYGPPTAVWDLGDRSLAKRDDVTSIAFAGSMYARREWNQFLRAMSKEASGFKVHHVGSHSRRVRRRRAITYHGLQNELVAADLVARAGVAYVPGWRSGKNRGFAITSFPSKLAFAVAAGAAVVYHGPTESSAAEFVRRYQLGAVVDSHEPGKLGRAVEAARDIALTTEFGVARAEVRQHEIGPHVLAQRFQEAQKQLGST